MVIIVYRLDTATVTRKVFFSIIVFSMKLIKSVETLGTGPCDVEIGSSNFSTSIDNFSVGPL